MKLSPLGLMHLLVLLLSFYLCMNASYANLTPTAWDVLRSQFKLNHAVNQPEVQAQLHWLVSHPAYLHKLASCEPYIYHIITEIKKRNMPGELALLPMIESAYNPFAYSGAGAAGLWQLMPGTGTYLGLKQDWWFDARRSIRSSTEAALNYLNYLHKFFNENWILAIAAYDAGEGTVERAIKNSHQPLTTIQFWSLPLPEETKAYVPRLLALAEIIRDPQQYRINLPDIPHEPYFVEVNIGSQIDLNRAASLAGISYRDLIRLNPGFNRWTTAPHQPFKLLIPTHKAAAFNRNLANVPTEKRVSWTRYQVRAGDTLESIAHHYFTTPKLIRELNQFKSDKLEVGQYVLIPSTKNTILSARKPSLATPMLERPVRIQSYKVIHIIQPGDTYPLLEKKYQVSAANIRRWNHFTQMIPLKPGIQLTIWKTTKSYGLYIVKPGDTLNGIAKHHKTTIANLAQLNPAANVSCLQPGQKLIIG